MFTGIVEELGTVTALDWPDVTADAQLTIRSPLVLADAQLGDSISVNGVCLTIAAQEGDTWRADLMPETLKRSALGGLKAGEQVNLERAMSATGRFGGHIVQGHVDGVAQLVERVEAERWQVLTFQIPSELASYLVEKGSITVSGVSLTLTQVSEQHFAVSLIPTTLENTTLGALEIGGRVNIEVDVIAKYVQRLVQPWTGSNGGNK